jgi:hypothetical protein
MAECQDWYLASPLATGALVHTTFTGLHGCEHMMRAAHRCHGAACERAVSFQQAGCSPIWGACCTHRACPELAGA